MSGSGLRVLRRTGRHVLMSSMPFRLALVGLLFLASTSFSSDPEPPPNADQLPVAFPEGVVSPNGRIAFIRNPDRGIDAINLADGSLLWRNAEATYPLLAGRHLLAQLPPVSGKWDQVRLVLLDPEQKGKVVWRSEPLTLPDATPAFDGEGHSLEARAWGREGRLFYQW